MTVKYVQFRIKLPYSLEAYNICQLYMASNHALSESKGEVQVSVLKNEKSTHPTLGDCQYTLKHMDIANKLPSAIKYAVGNNKALHFLETSHNAYPKCHTTYMSDYFTKEKFFVSVDSIHFEGNVDLNVNVLNIDSDIFSKAEFVEIDIYGKPYNVKYKAVKEENNDVCMTAIKFVVINVNCWGLGWMAGMVKDVLKDVFVGAHQRGYCERREWQGMSMEDIRRMEDVNKNKLDELEKEKKCEK